MSDFTKFPGVTISGEFDVAVGWEEISSRVLKRLSRVKRKTKVVVVEYYQGVLEEETTVAFSGGINPDLVILAKDCMWPESKIREMVYPDVTDDRIFGHMTALKIDDYFDPAKIGQIRKKIDSFPGGTILVIGTGASHVAGDRDILIYADMARWEIQLRMREHLVDNVGVYNRDIDDWMLLYKQGYFVDWRVCDRLKKKLMTECDYILDTNDRNTPKLVEGRAVTEGLTQTLKRPFSVVPFFDPGPWGGQWMKEYCGLDPEVDNYAWCFNCVPEENSLLLNFGGKIIEVPSIDLVFHDPRSLLGDYVYNRFGEEFPIRFDYLDTFDGGNLSLQVHPLIEYIREQFGASYTQDESYYMMDARPGAVVYLGLKDGVDPARMIDELEAAQRDGTMFDAEKHVQTWPVKKHDHFLIPAGTVHCSGRNSMVLEISATPYIFTFKLWDWGRLGLDGKPRPINIEHGKKVIQWNRTTDWTRKNLVNRFETVAEGDGWKEERTGLHEFEFIETRRHWFQKPVRHNTNGTVNVLDLVEGDEVIVESPTGRFAPFVVHYAETFIVPAAVGEYIISPHGSSKGKQCATVKAYVRNES
ncbi:MAG: class I mannose-6-phosphate isomerase [Bacteroidetes bacterium]|nr:class I mannose-6-phosphate isomerase [Bacteroidota bacterium]